MRRPFFIIIMVLAAALNGCGGGDNDPLGPQEDPDNDTQIGDGGTYTPSDGGTVPDCEEDAEGGCIEGSENTEVVTLSTQSIDFGINEFEAVECAEITIPGGLSFTAEVDKTNTPDYELYDEDGVATGETAYQFQVGTTGSNTAERTSGSGTLSICYLRGVIGSHTGQVKVVLNASDTTTAAYAYMISVRGETTSPVFDIESPVPYQVIHPDIDPSVTITSASASEGEYNLTAVGDVNVTQLSAIFAEGLSTPIIINVEGVLYGATMDTSGHFETDIGIPQAGGVYPVEFSIETNKDGMILSKKIYVVVMSEPEGAVEVRDNGGNSITNAVATDATELIVGFNISNLDTSGPAFETDSHPVTLTDIQWNGVELAGAEQDIELTYDHDDPVSHCVDENGTDYTGFEPTTTYCVALASITSLQTGHNTITAIAKNELGSVNLSFVLILDNTKPVITLTEPRENQLYGTSKALLTVSGMVQNFAPVDPSLWSIIDPENATNPKLVPGVDGNGSWCQPASLDEEDENCPASKVTLWINASPFKTPIYLYPKFSVPGDDAFEVNRNIGADSNGVYSTGHCYLNESEEEVLFTPGEDTETVVEADGDIVSTTTTTTSTTNADGTTTETTTVTITHTDAETGVVTQYEEGAEEEDYDYLTSAYDEDLGYMTELGDDIEAYPYVPKEYTYDPVTGEYVLAAPDYHDSELDEDEYADVDSMVHDRNTDTYTFTSTDAATGEITQVTQQRVCNIPSGTFEIEIAFPSDRHDFDINLYSNLLEIRAQSVSEHRTIKVASFQTGETNEHTPIPESKELYAGALGHIDPKSGRVDRPPVMLNLAEGIIKDKSVIMVVENMLNESFSFADLAAGGPLPTNESGNIDLEAEFKAEYQDREKVDFPGFLELTRDGNTSSDDEDWMEKYIWWNLHATMPQKFLALKRYRQMKMLEADTLDEAAEMNSAEIFFIDPDDSKAPNLSFDKFDADYFPANQSQYEVASDACGHRLTTSFMPYANFYDVYKTIYAEMGADDNAVKARILLDDVWPDAVAVDDNGDPDYVFNDAVEGRWIVEGLDLKDNGKIDADICLVPEDAIVTGCDEEDIVYGGKLPAFWMHVASMNLINGGITEVENDPVIPLIWSVGKLRLKLIDVIRLTKIPLTDENNALTGKYSNYLDIAEDTIVVDTSNISKTWETNSISLKPYIYCEEYYHEQFDARAPTRLETPLGCGNFPYNVAENDPKAEEYDAGYPVVLEVNSPAGQVAKATMASGGDNLFLLTIVWNKISETFKNILSCMDTEVVNPAINPDPTAFPYPGWVPDGKRVSMDFAVDNTDDGLSFVNRDEAVNMLASLAINLPEADLTIDDGGFFAGLSFVMGMGDVTLDEETVDYTQANVAGHLVRTLDDKTINTHWQNAPEDTIHAGFSLNIEELTNAITYLLYKMGPMELLDIMGIEDLQATDGYTVGIDKVTLGQMGICGDMVNKVLKTDLPPGLLFADVSSQFSAPALHLDIILDDDYPLTLAMHPIEGYSNATDIKLGINNLQISARDLIAASEEEGAECVGEANTYCIGDTEVLRVRADIVLSIKTIYHPEQQKINVFIEGRDDQNIHLSVVNPGTSYDDVSIVTDLYTLINNVFNQLNTTFDATDPDALATMAISLNPTDEGRVSLVGLNDIEVEAKMKEAANGDCAEGQAPTYAEEESASTNINLLRTPIIPRAQFVKNFKALRKTAGVMESLKKKTVLQRVANLKSPSTGLTTPTIDIPGMLNDGKDGEGDATDTDTDSDGKDGEENDSSTEEPLSPDDPCYPYSLNDGEEDDNPMIDALCQFGIEDIQLVPGLEFDNANGYIHMSSTLYITIYDWLEEEVNGSAAMEEQE